MNGYPEGSVGEVLSRIAVEKNVCPRCEAKPLNACVTIGGKKTKTHVPRWEALMDAYCQGIFDVVHGIVPDIILKDIKQGKGVPFT